MLFALWHQQFLLTTLGKDYLSDDLSQSQVSKAPMECTIARPSNTHLYLSVKRVMFFNGIFLSCTGVTHHADFP